MDTIGKEEREELEAVYKWYRAEEEKIMDRLQKEGRLFKGLDGHFKDFNPIHIEAKRRIREVGIKYGKIKQ